MSIKIKLERNIAEKSIKNYVLFCDENFKIQGLDKLSLANQSRVINKTISNNKLKDETFIIQHKSKSKDYFSEIKAIKLLIGK